MFLGQWGHRWLRQKRVVGVICQDPLLRLTPDPDLREVKRRTQNVKMELTERAGEHKNKMDIDRGREGSQAECVKGHAVDVRVIPNRTPPTHLQIMPG